MSKPFTIIGTPESDPALFEAFETLIGERAVPSDIDRQEHLRACQAVVLSAMDRANKRPKGAGLDLGQRHLAALEPCSIESRDTNEMSPTKISESFPVPR